MRLREFILGGVLVDTDSKKSLWLAIAFAGAWSILLLLPLILNGEWVLARQGYRYPYLMDLFHRAFVDGALYPRWLPDLAGGYGNPTFVYYPPLFWYIALPFSLLTHDPIVSSLIATWTILLAGGIGMYKIASRYCSLAGSLSIIMLFYLFPYILVQIYMRGCISELTSMMMCPWPLYFLLQIEDKFHAGQPVFAPALLFSLTLSLVIYAHPLITLITLSSLGLLMASIWADAKFNKRLLYTLSVATLLALIISSPYWLNLWLMRHDVRSGAAIHIKPRQNLDIIIQTLDKHYLSYVYALLAVIGCFFNKAGTFTKCTLTIIILCFFALSTSYLLPVVRLIPLADVIQLPMRFLSAWIPYALLAICFLIKRLENATLHPLASRLPLLICLGMLGIWLAYLFPKFRPITDFAAYKQKILYTTSDMTHAREFTPIDTDFRILVSRYLRNIPLVQVQNSLSPFLEIKSERKDSYLAFNIHALPSRMEKIAESGFPVIINQLYMSGWIIIVNGKPISLTEAVHPSALTEPALTVDKMGLMRLWLKGAEEYHVEAWYDGPPYWKKRNAMIALLVPILIYSLRRTSTTLSAQTIA